MIALYGYQRAVPRNEVAVHVFRPDTEEPASFLLAALLYTDIRGRLGGIKAIRLNVSLKKGTMAAHVAKIETQVIKQVAARLTSSSSSASNFVVILARQ